MQITGRVHPAVLRKMRNYAIRQALSEVGESREPKDIERIAKRHLLSYTELKQALNREQGKENKAQMRVDAE